MQTYKELEILGLMKKSSGGGGVQADLNVAVKRLPEGNIDAPLCDHNCVNNYQCPAAISLHPGLKQSGLAPAEKLLTGIGNTVAGMREFNQIFVNGGGLKNYFDLFKIPNALRGAIKNWVSNGGIEINAFGGNPELHPEIHSIIKELKERGFTVNLTTTGGRLMDDKFLRKFLDQPPDVLALSADDFESQDYVNELAKMSLVEIKKSRNVVSPALGEKRKAHEAIYAARLAQEYPDDFPPIIFNQVVHQGNLRQIESIGTALLNHFPTVRLNPYPGQSAFYSGDVVFSENEIPQLEILCDRMIDAHMDSTKREGLVPRLHYWLMLKANFRVFSNEPETLLRRMSGYDNWRCYRTPGAGRYVQFGASREFYKNKIAGGHLACFWNNNTVTVKSRQVWDMEANGIANYLNGGMTKLSEQDSQPCLGCIMPRLNGDIIALELGIDPMLAPAYLDLRREYVGF